MKREPVHVWRAPVPTKVAFNACITSVEVSHAYGEPQREPDDRVIVVHLVVDDRDSGAPLPLTFTARVKLDALAPDAWPTTLRTVLAALIMHELDEAIVVAAKRPFDPHAAPPATAHAHQ
jgi:hypothetical protein